MKRITDFLLKDSLTITEGNGDEITYINDFALEDSVSKNTQALCELLEFAIIKKCKMSVVPESPSGWPEVTLTGKESDVKAVVKKYWGLEDFEDYLN